MIYPGTDLKFKITVDAPGFDMVNHSQDATLIIKNSWNQVKYIIHRDDMLVDKDLRLYFMLPNVQSGAYYAQLTLTKEDANFDGGQQRIIDCQPLVRVGDCHHTNAGVYVCPADGVAVAYERVWTVNIEGVIYLADCYGNPILDKDGNRIYLRAADGGSESSQVTLDMTSEELKTLLEGRNDNGKIDTVPEVLDALGGMDEDTEVSVMTEEQTEAMMDRVLGR